jgi:hypothetical protein
MKIHEESDKTTKRKKTFHIEEKFNILLLGPGLIIFLK